MADLQLHYSADESCQGCNIAEVISAAFRFCSENPKDIAYFIQGVIDSAALLVVYNAAKGREISARDRLIDRFKWGIDQAMIEQASVEAAEGVTKQ